MSTTIFSNDYDYILSIQSKEPLLELLSTVNYPTYTSTEADIVVLSSVSFFQLCGPEGHSIESAHSALLELGLRVGDDNLSHTDIRLYKALAHSTFKGAEYLSTNPSFLVSVALSPTLEAETDFNAWYEEEHISLLSKVPGWQACRRFSLVDFESTVNSVSPPRYLALHAYKDLDGFTTSQFKAATNTSWRTKVMKEIVASERHVYRLQE
ncbi:uncharacterized protein C8R40DRAFT_1174070 [Lentinula edodes]|uniref:uncharacterized protein n=1 Tax=Lentinula edodes TaxID=5353 RepID=UPI001E8E7E64|nr:uncharacterized protein C8R40DRAFT_1174070 [Lentinula edodes]KAH7872003.1 hypothetical protein C8R40DRAFT_1174070 [Lentinula edodes]